MLMIGCTGDAVAASLIIVLVHQVSMVHNQALMYLTHHTSCFCPATLAAGRKGSLCIEAADILRSIRSLDASLALFR